MEVVTILGHQIAVKTLDTIILTVWTFTAVVVGFGFGVLWEMFKQAEEDAKLP